jgi:hypothetical protein
MDGIFIIMV